MYRFVTIIESARAGFSMSHGSDARDKPHAFQEARARFLAIAPTSARGDVSKARTYTLAEYQALPDIPAQSEPATWRELRDRGSFLFW